MQFAAACDCGDVAAVKASVVDGLVRASAKGHSGVVAFLLSCAGIDVNSTNVRSSSQCSVGVALCSSLQLHSSTNSRRTIFEQGGYQAALGTLEQAGRNRGGSA